MVLEFWRDRLNSHFGIGCISIGHPVATRPLNGITITRPPFEAFSNQLVNFPNEVGTAGLADFFSNSPEFGEVVRSIPFYGWKPVNQPYQPSSDALSTGLASLSADLFLNGLDSFRSRILMGAPSGESNLQHTNLKGSLCPRPSRTKYVPYQGFTPEGFPKFKPFVTSPSNLSVVNINSDIYNVNSGANQTYQGKICYLVDALEKLQQRVASGAYNTSPASSGVGGGKFATSYSNLTWEINPLDPYAVSSVEFLYKLELSNYPLFDSEEVMYRVKMTWETIPGPWIGIGTNGGSYNMLNAVGKIKQSYSASYIYSVTSELRPDTPLYQWAGYAPLFAESYSRPIHATSTKEVNTVDVESVHSLLQGHDTALGGAIPSTRLSSFNAGVTIDLNNFQPVKFLAFTDAVTKAFQRLNINMLENLAQYKSTLALIDFSGYVRTFDKRRKAKKDLHLLLDVLSSAYLMKIYGIDPIGRDLQELVENLAPLIESIKSLTDDTIVSRGSYSVDLPAGTYGYKSVRVTGNCKVVGHFNLTSFFLAAYVVDSVGLSPTLERLWDLVDWSFVVDMFFNVGDRLKILDDGLRTASFVLDYRVSTIKVSAYIDDETLSSRSLVAGTMRPELRYVNREISRYTPRLGFTAYDIVPQGRPNWAALGALLIQVLD